MTQDETVISITTGICPPIITSQTTMIQDETVISITTRVCPPIITSQTTMIQDETVISITTGVCPPIITSQTTIIQDETVISITTIFPTGDKTVLLENLAAIRLDRNNCDNHTYYQPGTATLLSAIYKKIILYR